MPDTKHIVIIGGGFCGALTAINLVKDASSPLKITLVHSGTPLVKGIAFTPYLSTHLLNVEAGCMSAFPDDTDHFINWLSGKNEYSAYPKDLLKKTFIPRNIYGEYLLSIWNATLATIRNSIELNVIDDYVTDIEFDTNSSAKIILQRGLPLSADYVVLATGNSLPRNPPITNMDYYSSSTFYRNPWNINSVRNLKPDGDVVIIGNGLTMADTVIGLVEHGFKNKIYSISRNGFGILPHRHFGIKYNGLVEELQNKYELRRLVTILNKHIKKIRKLGISAGPVIDSLRPYSQLIWQAFSPDEKKQFLSRFRYMWGVARHRLPVFIYDTIEKLRLKGQLEVYRGELINIIEKENQVFVTFYNAKKQRDETVQVQRVINCTGPETSIHTTTNSLLRKLSEKNIISCDPLELGINTDVSTYNVLTANDKKNPALFTLGTNLKGMLWETTAVPELSVQCKQLAGILLQACEQGN